MDTLTRRQLMVLSSNPDETIDFLVSLSGQVKQPLWYSTEHSPIKSIAIRICYVPDRLILEETSLPIYLDGIRTEKFSNKEQAGITLLNDLNNELVPRWLRVTLTSMNEIHGYPHTYEVCFQDSQPNWNNSKLLSGYQQG